MTRPAIALVRLIPAPRSGTPDAQLLGTFIATRAEEAFAELVRRHGPMVLATCRRVLGNAHDAEDAFQAVFLVLARKANAIRGANLAGWLHAVAVRTARGVRVMRDQRRKRELVVANGRGAPEGEPATPDHDLAAVLDEELARLPDHYREAVVLCELRGLSRKEAAAELRVPEGTLSSRLASARRKLAERLAARGLAAPAALAAALVPATVSAGLVTSAVAAVRGAAGPVASAAAGVVVKAMLFDQLKAVVLAAGLLLTVACGGWAMTGTPGGDDPASAQAPRVVVDPNAELVQQLGAAEFADREAAAKQLRELGAKALTSLRAGLKSENPEIRERSTKVLAEIHKDALDKLAKEFDPAKEQQPDHPIWQRFKAIAGDSRASRDLFAGIIKNPNWLRRLDAAETKPEAAAQQYRAALVEVGKTFRFNMSVSFHIPVWPCDRGEEVAYLLLLGSYPNTSSARPAGQDPEFGNFMEGESRIHFGHGLGRGLQGKLLEAGGKFEPDPTVAAPGTDRVFARLFAAWLDRREPASEVMPSCLWLAAGRRAKEVLPLARIIAADRFPHDKLPPPELYAAALAVVARFGTREDLPLFEQHFKNEMVATTFEFAEPNPAGGTTTRKGTTQVRDAAAGYALVLHGEDPAKYGFPMVGRQWAMPFPRWYTEPFDRRDLGFLNDDDKARSAAHAKVKEFLDKQPKPESKKDEPKPNPVAVKLVEQLGAAEFADREAAEKGLENLGEPALAALRAAAAGAESAEVRKRAADLVRRIERRIEVPVNLKLDGHTAHVNGVAFFPGGDKILTVGDMTYRIWDAKTGKELSHGEQGSEGYDGGGPAAVSPDGKRIAVRYFVADPASHKFLFGLEGHTAPRTRITYANDGTRILSASEDGTVRLWRPDFEKELLKIDAHLGKTLPPVPFSGGNVPRGAKPPERFENRGARDAVFSPDGKRIVSGGDDGTVRIWNADTGKEIRHMTLEKVIVTSVAFLGQRKVISGGSDGIIRVWDVNTGVELRQFKGHTNWIRAIAVSPDGARVVSASDDGTARVWDADTGKELRCFRGHTGQVYAVAIAPDGRTAVTGGADKTARVWSLPAAVK